jgi:integrase/recombinase XerD
MPSCARPNTPIRPVRTLCMALAYSGCRLSEALALRADRAHFAVGLPVSESLMKRRTGVSRTVPVPPALLKASELMRGIRLWPWARWTGRRAGMAVMEAAGHGGARPAQMPAARVRVAAVIAGIPLNIMQKWPGHGPFTTTAIDADAVGAEGHDTARRMWRN